MPAHVLLHKLVVAIVFVLAIVALDRLSLCIVFGLLHSIQLTLVLVTIAMT